MMPHFFQKHKTTFFFTLFTSLLLFLSLSLLVYVELYFPNYSVSQRTSIIWQVLTQEKWVRNNWLKIYNQSQFLTHEIQRKKIKLHKLNDQIELKKKEISLLKSLEKRLGKIQNRLDALEKN